MAADARFHGHGGEFDDLVPAVIQARGLRVQDHQTVIALKEGVECHYFAPSSLERWNLDLLSVSTAHPSVH